MIALAQTSQPDTRESGVCGGHLENPQISCLFSKQAPAFFLSPTPYFLPQDFPSPWPAGEGPSLLASQAERTQDSINTGLSSNKQLRKSGNTIRPQQTSEPAGRGGGGDTSQGS